MRTLWMVLLCSYLLQAHQTGLSYIKLTQKPRGEVAVVYKKPLEDSQAKGISINFPASCRRSRVQSIGIENGFIIEQFSLSCSHRSLKGSRIWIDGLLTSDKGVLIYYEEDGAVESTLLRASHAFMLINDNRSALQLFVEYIGLGFFHILSGYDHLLFLFALLLLVDNYKTLFYSITAFTISHSITLGLSALHLLRVPIPFVEAMIALSILILYREVIEGDDASLSRRHLPWMVLLFGLLHGLGFASVLMQIGLPQDDIPTALFAFNIGIELGQLLFVTTALSLGFLFKLIPLILDKKAEIVYLLAYIFGSLSTLWFIERVLKF